MNYDSLKGNICGPMMLPLTPFNEKGDLELGIFEDQMEHLIENGHVTGCSTLLIGGATAQFYAMTLNERKKLAKSAVEIADGRVPIIFSVQHTGTRQAIELATYAADVGADAIQISPPYYYFGLSDEVTRKFFEDIANATDIGVLIYNTPWHGYDISAKFLEQLCEIDNVVATKWSSYDGINYRKGYELCADKIAMIDNSMPVHLSFSHQLGASGYIACIDLFAPPYDLEVWELMENGEYVEANTKIREFIVPFYDIIYSESGESPAVWEAMRLVGKPTGIPRAPEPPTISEKGKKQLRKLLESVNVEIIV